MDEDMDPIELEHDLSERPQCEECWTESDRICSRCGRRICRACATKHRMGLVEFDELPEDAKPPWCRPLTKAEQRLLDRLPLGRRDVERDTRRRLVYVHLLRDRYVRWTDGDILIRLR